jgi:hypothetical protein
MSTGAQQILAAFDALPDDERDTVLAELLTRRPIGAGELPDQALVEMAEELFLSYDAAEAADATRPS